MGWAQRKPALVTQPAVLLDAACVTRENKFLMQVYLLWRRDNQQQEVAEEEGQELLPQPKAGAKVR